MQAPSLELGPSRFRAIQRATCAVARTLAQAHGQRQFYTLSQVRASASEVSAELQPWVFAVFVTRADFEAWFALRETPAPYDRLRAALSTPDVSADVPEGSPLPDMPDGDWEFDDADLWWTACLEAGDALS